MSIAKSFFAKQIAATSDLELFKACWSEINADWPNQPRDNGDSVMQRVCVGEGLESPYRFAARMRKMIDHETAEVYEVWSGSARGYFVVGEFDPDGTKAAFYLP